MEKTALRKALETTGDGAALLPYDLESYLGEELMKVQPLAELIPVLQAEIKTHEYNLKTSHPMGWFEGESTPANFKNGTYARKSTMLKIQRIWGSVTGFARSMDEAFIDAFTEELNGSLQGMADIFEFGILYACSGDTASLVMPSSTAVFSPTWPPVPLPTSSMLVVKRSPWPTWMQLLRKLGAFRQSRNDPKLWMMVLQMKQIVDGLQTKIQIPLTSTVLNDGQITMANYANSPIFETDYVAPEAVSTSPADLAGVAACRWSLNASVKYRIASVTAFGEQVAGSASAAIDATGKQESYPVLHC